MEIKGDFINYGSYIDVHDNEVVNLNVGNGEVEIEKKSSRFPACLNYEQGMGAFTFLKDNGFISSKTDPMNFLYQMGCTEEQPEIVVPILWKKKNKQLLREMLELWFKRLIDEKSLTKAKMEEICAQVFIDKDNEMIHLAKNKVVPSIESDELKEYFATI